MLVYFKSHYEKAHLFNNISSTVINISHNKGRELDEISIKMTQLRCDIFPLSIAFKTALKLKSGIFPDNWKKINIVPIQVSHCLSITDKYRIGHICESM